MHKSGVYHCTTTLTANQLSHKLDVWQGINNNHSKIFLNVDKGHNKQRQRFDQCSICWKNTRSGGSEVDVNLWAKLLHSTEALFSESDSAVCRSNTLVPPTNWLLVSTQKQVRSENSQNYNSRQSQSEALLLYDLCMFWRDFTADNFRKNLTIIHLALSISHQDFLCKNNLQSMQAFNWSFLDNMCE
jgi:hypothetical protein